MTVTDQKEGSGQTPDPGANNIGMTVSNAFGRERAMIGIGSMQIGGRKWRVAAIMQMPG